jgi:hypothetical protein
MFQQEYTAALAGAVLTLTPIAGRLAGPKPEPSSITVTFPSAAAVPSYLKNKRVEVTLSPRT